CDDVFHVRYNANIDLPNIYICAKGTTPGGRRDLADEQRIQPKAKYLNYVFDRGKEGEKAVFLGIYNRDGETIFCAWRVVQSSAASGETPISKQIKITSIAKAIREGFVQQDKGNGEYACAFKPEFLYFYLRNNEWLHTGHVGELSNKVTPENSGEVSQELSGEIAEKGLEKVSFYTGLDSAFERNRIVFGAPGTGKSYTLKCDSEKLLADNPGNYERVTFHPDYTYSQFVGTYKPTTDDETSKICYAFVPGPFMRVLVEALDSARSLNPQPYLLLIEEINRAKVAAVFGDVFQLLDRDEYGVSEYEIQASE
ncbi:MAG: AAA family ATPase, partial [Enterococcus sp.]